MSSPSSELRVGPLRACVVGLLAVVLAYGVLASAPARSWLGASAIGFQQLVGDFGMVAVQIHSLSLVQRIAPRAQLARVNGAIAFGSSWAMLAGSTLGVLAGSLLGSRGMIVLAAAGFALAAVVLARAARTDSQAR